LQLEELVLLLRARTREAGEIVHLFLGGPDLVLDGDEVLGDEFLHA
jgi:hypothetical protein